MSKIKIEEVALEAGANDKDAIEKAKELGYSVRAKNSTITEEQAEVLMEYLISGKKPEAVESKPEKKEVTKKQVAKKEAVKKTSAKKEPIKKIKKIKSNESSIKESKIDDKETKSKKVASKVTEKEISLDKAEKSEVKVAKEKKQEELSEEKKIEKKPEKEKEIVKKVVKKRKGITAAPKIKPEEQKEEKETIEAVKKEPVKRRGITIIKKKNPKPITQKRSSASNLKMESSAPKKKKKKTPVTAKDAGKRLDIGDRYIGGNNELYEEEEVVLLDFSDKIIFEEQQRQELKRKEEARKRAVMGGSQKNNANRVHYRSAGQRKRKKRDYKNKEVEVAKIDVVKIPEDVRVYEFAEKIGKNVGEIVKTLFALGTMVTKNDFLDKDSIEILADEFDVEVETINPLDELNYVAKYDEEEDKNSEERPPVVTIMGHVDHGKTSLLDKIRSTKVTAREAGGITQHVGAYQVEKNGKKVTFIDTPGHSAFTQMRARGAQATDIAIIVVAADDGVMPQTKESISHAKAAGVPIIIAVNKIDKEAANIDNVKSQLAEIGIMPVDWGGEYEFVPVSAHSGEGIDELLETILLQAEIMELEADSERKAKAIVIESSVEKGLGTVANIIVKNGSLSVGDNIIVGTTYGRVKTMILDDGSRAKKIGPSTPAAIVGLDNVPDAGDILIGVDSEKDAREVANKRRELARTKELSKSTKVSIDELSDLIAEGKIKKLPIIVKADVQGSLQAIKQALAELKNEEVEVHIIHSGIGGVTESDVVLADASEHCYIAGFNVKATGAVKSKAKEIGVEIKTYSIIYDLLDDAKALLGGLMSPVVKEEAAGKAEVRQTFSVAKVGTIAGCMVTDGKIERNSVAKLVRAGEVIYEGKISSLKRFNDDTKEVSKGYECGIMLDGFNELEEGDVIEAYKLIEEQVTL